MSAIKWVPIISVALVALIYIIVLVTKKGSNNNDGPENRENKDPRCVCEDIEKSFGPILVENGPDKTQGEQFIASILNLTKPVPKSWDWSKYPERVGPVEMQFAENCWAYGTAGILEGLQYHLDLVDRSSSKPIKLSEQFITECLGQPRYCTGWTSLDAIDSIRENGVATSESYPVSRICESNLTCQDTNNRLMRQSIGGAISKLVESPGDGISETELKKLVAFYGPVSVGTMIDNDFRAYKSPSKGSRVLKLPRCKTDRANHDILLVGYGQEKETKENYWILRNSNGTSWGFDGYVHVHRNESNCSYFYDVTLAYFGGQIKLDYANTGDDHQVL